MSGHFNLSNNRSKFGIGANLSQSVPQDLTQQEFGSRGIHNDKFLIFICCKNGFTSSFHFSERVCQHEYSKEHMEAIARWVELVEWLEKGRTINKDSTLFTWTEPPRGRGVTERGNGIVPGGIAAAVFIGLLLGLYAILWKCMVTEPKRKQTMRMRDQKGPRKDLLC